MTPSTIPAASKSLDAIPGPKGVPLVGNMFEIKQATMIQDLIKLAREWGPLFRLNTPTGTRYVASGLEMVDDLCDDARFDKLVGGQPARAPQDPQERRPVHGGHRRPAVEVAHDILLPSFSTWAMKGYLDPMIDIAEQMCLKWERLNPDEPIDVAGRHDAADPRHDRAVRVQLPVQLVLPRHPAPLRRSDDGRAARDPGTAAPAPDRDQGAPRGPAAADGRQPSTWTTRSARSSPSARRAAIPAPTCWGTCSSARTSRGTPCPTTTSSPSASRSWSPATRPPAACCRSRSPTCSRSGGRRPRPGRGRPRAGHRPVGAADCRAGPAARATSGRSSTRRCASGRRRPRSPARPAKRPRSAGGGPSSPGRRSSH